MLLPGAVQRPVSYTGEARAFTNPPLGWVLHVTVMNGSPFHVFQDAAAGNRRFSHGWVARDGSGEQYADLSHDSWAQAAGNDSYWSFETEGFPTEPLTAAQIHTLAVWHVATGTSDLLALRPGDHGIICHYAGGTAWGGHTCPDTIPGLGPRSRQRSDILAAARLIRQQKGSTVTEDDAKLFRTVLADWDVSSLVGEAPGTVNFQTALGRIYKWTKPQNAPVKPEPPA